MIEDELIELVESEIYWCVNEPAENKIVDAAKKIIDLVREQQNSALLAQIEELTRFNDTLKGQLESVDEVNSELGIIGMTGSIAWKAQIKRLAQSLSSLKSSVEEEG